MPAVADHTGQAQRNQRLLDALRLLGNVFPEWIVTAGFYTLVHYSEALLDHFSHLHSATHWRREENLAALSQRVPACHWVRDFLPHFQRLKTLSQFARYGLPDETLVDWSSDPLYEEFEAEFAICVESFRRNCPDLF